ncbi:NUDIX domain-containing protein [Ekhidna sp. To15]|uniref:NUDIX domain-containing protein n=1 Tax=Ekhidna sp. To15 TaxID=3395267 RepID=UPI003F524D13
MQDENPWITHSSKEIYSNPWIELTEHDVTNPGGGKSLYGKVHYKNWALGIVPLDENQNTWLVGQFRYTLDEYSWEIPMGGGPLEISKLESAQRELKEETGLTAKKWTEICKIHTSNSVTDEIGIAYLAEELTEGETAFEETEDLQIKKLPFKEAVLMCDRGEITDSLSVAAIYRLSRILAK